MIEIDETRPSLSMTEIMGLLPHRYPFLMVDRIVSIKDDEEAIGIKNVSANEPQFMGHFPGQPVFPGVLIIEAMAQTAGAICARHTGGGGKSVVYFMTIDNAKFRRPVGPGDVLELHVKKEKQRRNIWRFACEAIVSGQKVAEATVSAMLGSSETAS
ncbi:3-hydroxyacyl-ACP dehydratase FabZ [Notoacmeibacter ruber]|uniref:3-hydroxyacyl-[acyl-carrier-protein] dehydratase FabZ n=1 Tax=Notoacmeibacter ruber TaxID=2670375 RepID=A0A3L7JEH4_9HYPH|nr:3-hydroxyacyl-ACP dehydratase FabZ [Notoacmeibacter ruber]RLQ87971.1 3-hydroxyacyl-[acyl-carrier-protein] dehydratase FabZ [Notoacmeibacter ruber]